MIMKTKSDLYKMSEKEQEDMAKKFGVSFPKKSKESDRVKILLEAQEDDAKKVVEKPVEKPAEKPKPVKPETKRMDIVVPVEDFPALRKVLDIASAGIPSSDVKVLCNKLRSQL